MLLFSYSIFIFELIILYLDIGFTIQIVTFQDLCNNKSIELCRKRKKNYKT